MITVHQKHIGCELPCLKIVATPSIIQLNKVFQLGWATMRSDKWLSSLRFRALFCAALTLFVFNIILLPFFVVISSSYNWNSLVLNIWANNKWFLDAIFVYLFEKLITVCVLTSLRNDNGQLSNYCSWIMKCRAISLKIYVNFLGKFLGFIICQRRALIWLLTLRISLVAPPFRKKSWKCFLCTPSQN